MLPIGGILQAKMTITRLIASLGYFVPPQHLPATKCCRVILSSGEFNVQGGEVDVFAALLGVIVGFCLQTGWTALAARRSRKAYWASIRAEMRYCGNKAAAYLNSGILIPSYRLPTFAFQTAVPALLADGAMKEGEYESIVNYYTDVQSFNWGLEQAQVHHVGGNVESRKSEISRVQAKAKNLVPGKVREATTPLDKCVCLINQRLE